MTGSPQFAGSGGHATYAVLELAGGTDSARTTNYQAIEAHLAAPGLSTQVGGLVPTMSAINKQVTSDIGRAEAISLPVLLVLLLLIFGSLAAASLPLAIGGIAILGAFAVLRLLTLVTDVSIFSINVITMLGLGLAIDYALFMVSRFREELRAPGHRRRAAVAAHDRHRRPHRRWSPASPSRSRCPACCSSRRCSCGSMGYGGMATVLVAMLAALTVLPAAARGARSAG